MAVESINQSINQSINSSFNKNTSDTDAKGLQGTKLLTY